MDDLPEGFSKGRITFEVPNNMPLDIFTTVLSPTRVYRGTNGTRVTWILPDTAQDMDPEEVNQYIKTLGDFLYLVAAHREPKLIDVI